MERSAATPRLGRRLGRGGHDAQLDAVALPGRVVQSLFDLLVDVVCSLDEGLQQEYSTYNTHTAAQHVEYCQTQQDR